LGPAGNSTSDIAKDILETEGSHLGDFKPGSRKNKTGPKKKRTKKKKLG
jgi:hypothetical protein